MDPPRDAVPFSVKKCKAAGIKVIMVTGDQPITAAAIAKKCNIISEKTVAEVMEETKLPFEQAFRKANAIVIHGDELAAAMREDEGLPEEERGRKLANWLHKPQIVFARTSPAQKLIIVQGCQKLGHVVAVTGDGVNDSPAIKKADIGIAMGITGSEVAKDAADMVLLTDDFSAIIVGVEEGRKIFDNFKKTIIYCLASNISEMMPFITFVIFQFPLPLSSVLVLCIDIGTDMLPCVSFVFEDGELDLMTRPPRQKWEHMVTSRLIVFSYLQNGAIESCCGMLAYFTAMADWGMPFWSIFYTVQRKGFAHPEEDIFDETMANFGNSDAYCDPQSGSIASVSDQEWRAPDWLYLSDKNQDLRMYYLTCENGVMKQNWDWGACIIPQISGLTQKPICYSTEALKYAQSAFFYATVFGQISCAFLLKTRMMSIQYQGIKNFFLTFAIHFETALMLLGAFCYPFNVALGTRDNVWIHMGVMGIPFSIFLMIHDEFRKFLIRNFPQPDPGKPNWFYRNSLW
jgi:sodium/potassium-transporting ATPase subunit alpha